MKGTVNISEFMAHLQQNNLVIVPQEMLTVDTSNLKKTLLRKNMASYKEIADSQIWGAITKTRVLQLAKEHCRLNELVLVPCGRKRINKINRAAILRIARIRGLETQNQ